MERLCVDISNTILVMSSSVMQISCNFLLTLSIIISNLLSYTFQSQHNKKAKSFPKLYSLKRACPITIWSTDLILIHRERHYAIVCLTLCVLHSLFPAFTFNFTPFFTSCSFHIIPSRYFNFWFFSNFTFYIILFYLEALLCASSHPRSPACIDNEDVYPTVPIQHHCSCWYYNL